MTDETLRKRMGMIEYKQMAKSLLASLKTIISTIDGEIAKNHFTALGFIEFGEDSDDIKDLVRQTKKLEKGKSLYEQIANLFERWVVLLEVSNRDDWKGSFDETIEKAGALIAPVCSKSKALLQELAKPGTVSPAIIAFAVRQILMTDGDEPTSEEIELFLNRCREVKGASSACVEDELNFFEANFVTSPPKKECAPGSAPSKRPGLFGRKSIFQGNRSDFIAYEKRISPEKGPLSKPSKKKQSRVQYSILAPKRIAKGRSFLLDFYMYEDEFKFVMSEALAEGRGKLQAKNSGMSLVEEQSEITIRLHSPNIPSIMDEETFAWEKGYHAAQLIGEIPEDYAQSNVILVVDVLVYGLKVTSLKCLVDLMDPKSSLSVIRDDIKKAFFSYSSKDRNSVLLLKQGMESICPDIECFVDVLSLRSGENWSARIQQKIDESDCFFLVWSENAFKSKEVEKEWSYALAARGIDFIHPLALEPIDQNRCPVPKSLESIHFGNVNALLRR